MYETNIYNLPFEMLEEIASYLPDTDLVSFSLGVQNFDIVRSSKKSFNFSDGKIDEETFVKAIEMYGNRIESLNINNCEHLCKEAIEFALKTCKLKELHMVNAGTAFDALLCQKIIPSGLKRLSIDHCFYFMLINDEGGFAEVNEVFREVEELYVSVRMYDVMAFLITGMALLKKCPNLVSLTVNGFTNGCEKVKSHIAENTARNEHFAIDYNLLPKLKPQNVNWDIKDISEAPEDLPYLMTPCINLQNPDSLFIVFSTPLTSFTLQIINTE
jgi:hypothetical protein